MNTDTYYCVEFNEGKFSYTKGLCIQNIGDEIKFYCISPFKDLGLFILSEIKPSPKEGEQAVDIPFEKVMTIESHDREEGKICILHEKDKSVIDKGGSEVLIHQHTLKVVVVYNGEAQRTHYLHDGGEIKVL